MFMLKYDVEKKEISLCEYGESSNIRFKPLKSKSAALKKIARFNNKVIKGERFVRYCKKCEMFFTMSDKEQDWYKERDFKLPNKCPVCRHSKNKVE